VKYLILEKVLFTKVIDYDEISQLLRINKVKTWVNCPRRMMQVYQNLKKEITGTIQLSVTGSNWGLGCNGIHFLDLFAFLSNSKKIVLTNNLIDETIIESKRKGFDEFTGTITGESENNTFQITSLSSGNSPISVTIMTQNTCYQIQEGPTGTLIKRNLENQLYLEEQKFSMPFQSQLTNIVVDQLIENGDCNLTTLEESSNLHLEFLSNFISFLQNKNKTIDECLIT
jgi:predicted dehydrogenase